MSNLNVNNTNLKNNHCKTELALLVGNDLSDAEANAVKRHIAVCPDCREHYQNLEQGMQPLREYAQQATPAPQVDLWSGIEKQLQAHAHVQRRQHLLHTLAPAVSVVVACTVLFMVMGQNDETGPVNNFVPEATSVNHPPAFRNVSPLILQQEQFPTVKSQPFLRKLEPNRIPRHRIYFGNNQ